MLLSIVGEHLFALLFHRSPFIASLLIAQPVIKSLAMERLKILVNILIIPNILLPVPLLLMWMLLLISFQLNQQNKYSSKLLFFVLFRATCFLTWRPTVASAAHFVNVSNMAKNIDFSCSIDRVRLLLSG